MFCQRGSSYSTWILHIIVLFSCISFSGVVCGPCFMNENHEQIENNDACGSFQADNYGSGFANAFPSDGSGSYMKGNSNSRITLESVCAGSDSFCFPSTIPGFPSEDSTSNRSDREHTDTEIEDPLRVSVRPRHFGRWMSNSSWSSDYGMSILSNGRAVSCSLNSRKDIDAFSNGQMIVTNQNELSSCRGLVNQKGASLWRQESELIKLNSFDGILPPHVEVIPPVLDWGESLLYVPSFASITVSNVQNDSVLHVYRPFSTDTQFFPCNFTEAYIGFGEVASICFVFLPKQLGLSSGSIILQTSFGGLVVQAKGFAINSSGIQPLFGFDTSFTGRWRKNMSLFNPFDETVHVEEVSLWVFTSLENSSLIMDATCSLENSDDLGLLSIKDWFIVKSDRIDMSLTAVKPHRIWEISPESSETIVEIDFSFGSVGNIFGALCMQLTRSAEDQADIIMVPIEAEIDPKIVTNDSGGPLSVSVEGLMLSDASVAISLTNGAAYVMSFIGISEVGESKIFEVKYVKGLVLFPGSITLVAIVSCQLPDDVRLSSPEVPDINGDCKLLVNTNDSSSVTEIPCWDIIHVCSRYENAFIGHQHEKHALELGSTRTNSLTSRILSLSYAEVPNATELDELVLGNWKSQGTGSKISVLVDHEVLFPVVQVGTHCLKWIAVQNPSGHPAIMQLILNSGEIIDECREPFDPVQPILYGTSIPGKNSKLFRFGFSVAEGAQTEAYVSPYSSAYFGPIIFHPSDQCRWRSSAFIRNNLSGVEWLSLHGFGGSHSLAVLEGSDPVRSIDFYLKVPSSVNFSHPAMTSDKEKILSECFKPLMKELHVRNTGNLSLEVQRIKISGTDCGLKGFLVQNCAVSALEPGESTKLSISYKSDFASAVVYADLELALASGILVIPMKATIQPYMLELCKESASFMHARKLVFAVLVAAVFVLLVYYIFLPAGPWVSWSCRCKGEEDAIPTKRTARKSSDVLRNKKNLKFPASAEVGFFPSENETLIGCAGCKSKAMSHGCGMNDLHMKPYLETPDNSGFADVEQERSLTSSSSLPNLETAEGHDTEASQPVNLTVRIGKEKGRRRRKRRGGGAALTGLFEVSSSHSGNSTPSSPLSPVIPVTPKKIRSLSPDEHAEVKHRSPDQIKDKGQYPELVSKVKLSIPDVPVDHQSKAIASLPKGQPKSSGKSAKKTVLLSSPTFSSVGGPGPFTLCPSPSLISSATIAPHARAPGSKLDAEQPVKSMEKANFEKEYTYDIWGDHLSNLASRSKYNSLVISNGVSNISDSFFSRGPQTLLTKSPPGCGSFQQGG